MGKKMKVIVANDRDLYTHTEIHLNKKDIEKIIALIEKEEEYQDKLDALEEAMDEDWSRTGFQS